MKTAKTDQNPCIVFLYCAAQHSGRLASNTLYNKRNTGVAQPGYCVLFSHDNLRFSPGKKALKLFWEPLKFSVF